MRKDEVITTAEEKKSYFNIPKLDFSGIRQEVEALSEEDMDRICKRMERESEIDWRKFVENVEKHPERLLSWDMSMSFDEFARRVRAGEYD